MRLNLSRKYTSSADAEEFFGNIKEAYKFIAVVMLILGVAGFFFWLIVASDIYQEQKIYMTLQGKELVYNDYNKSSIETARLFKALHLNQYNFSQLDTLDSDNVSKAKDDIGAAMYNWDMRAKYLNNASMPIPQDDTGEAVTGFLVKVLIILLAVCPSVVYAKRDDDSNDDWWQYPWKKWWAYPAIIPLAPYVIAIQPFVLIYAVSNETIKYIRHDEDGPSLTESDTSDGNENIRSDKWIKNKRSEFAEIVEAVKNNEEGAKQNFGNILQLLLEKKKNELTSDVEEVKQKMSELGKKIQENQKTIGEKMKEIKDVETSLKNEHKPDTLEEFERIRSIPMVSAVSVDKTKIKIFTKTIFINHNGKTYEIGNSIITIDPSRDYVNVTIHGSTSRERDHPHSRSDESGFCFGGFHSDIYDYVSQGKYYQAVLVILHSLQTIEVAEWGDKMKQWKETETK